MADFYQLIMFIYTIPHFLKYVRMHSLLKHVILGGTTLC